MIKAINAVRLYLTQFSYSSRGQGHAITEVAEKGEKRTLL